jgi:hypothetical protein
MPGRNLYGEALSAIDAIPNIASPPVTTDDAYADAQIKAARAAALASLAAADAAYALRDEIEALKGRLPKR